MLTQYQNIQQCKIYSEAQISSLRGGLAQKSIDPGIAIIAVGSLARREASAQSDLDYFVVHRGDVPIGGVIDAIDEAIEAIGLRKPSPIGVFATTVSQDEFLRTIGGTEESNGELTRRMLFLLESDWLCGQELYQALFLRMIERYIGDKITQHQLARFFLNDLLRYYRTICVDFEYKTASAGKSWGDRNVKLMFSRKLLYFSGVVAAAQTVQSACCYKRAELLRLLSLSPLKRIEDVCGHDAFRVFEKYDKFLGWMADGSKRELLKSTTDDREQHSDDFREMKNAAHHFSWELESLLHRRYAGTHPIYQALIF